MSFPRYPKYKSSGVEWLGDVPQGWEVRRLKNLVEEPLKYGANEAAELDDRTLPRFVRITDIGEDGRLRDETFKSLPTEVAEPYLLKEGDVLLARSGGTVGKSFIYKKAWGTACFAGYLIRARLRDSNCKPMWLYYFCQTDEYWGYVVGSQIQATIQNVSAEKYANLFLPLPPREEQGEIASFLDRQTSMIDALVGEQRRLIELLQEKRQAVISRAVTKGLNPDTAQTPSGVEWLGDVPSHWEVGRIANVFREVAESGVGDLPILSVSIHHGVSDKEFNDEEMDRKVTRSDDRSKYKRVVPGDLVYNMMRAWQGGFGTVTVEGMVSPAYVVARPKTSIATAYVEHLLRTPQAIEQMRRYSRGITDFRLRLYWDEFKNIQIPLPPEQEAVEICRSIKSMDNSFNELTAEAERAIELLQERRAALISAAVTGKIDVRDIRDQ